jgi:hypothetical protein
MATAEEVKKLAALKKLQVCYTTNMNAITIPKSLAGNDDLVLLPRNEYENLVTRTIGGLKLTKAQKQDLNRARKSRASGKMLSYHDFIRELGLVR